MSPENDTPQHDDEATTPHEALTLAFLDSDARCSWTAEGHASHALEALKEAGFEIVKRSELGAIKRTERDLSGSLMGDVLDQVAPGASEAAQRGIEVANRSIGFVGQKAAEANDGLQEHLDAVAAARFGIEPKSSKWLDDMTLAAALELIGRRTDIVAVQLPEPDSHDVWYGPGKWIVHTGMAGERVCAESPNDDLFEFTSDAARQLVANMLAAAARADAAEGEAK